jgi:hypothetical protein
VTDDRMTAGRMNVATVKLMWMLSDATKYHVEPQSAARAIEEPTTRIKIHARSVHHNEPV